MLLITRNYVDVKLHNRGAKHRAIWEQFQKISTRGKEIDSVSDREGKVIRGSVYYHR